MDAYQIGVIVGYCAKHATYPSGDSQYFYFHAYLIDGVPYVTKNNNPRGRIVHKVTFVPEPVVRTAMRALINDTEIFGSIVWC